MSREIRNSSMEVNLWVAHIARCAADETPGVTITGVMRGEDKVKIKIDYGKVNPPLRALRYNRYWSAVQDIGRSFSGRTSRR